MRAAGATEVEEITEEGILPLAALLIAGVVALSALANIVIKLSRLWKCGVIVDARLGTPQVRKDCALPRGAVIVLTGKDERAEFNEPSQVEISDALVSAIGA